MGGNTHTVFATLGTLLLASFAASVKAAEEPPSFYDDIKPLFAVHCYKCHTGETPKAGLRLDIRSFTLTGGKSGQPAIIPGAAARSEMVRRIASADPDEQMPPKGPRLTGEEIQRIKRWIDAGAPWPDRDDYWAFRPLKPQQPPSQGSREPVRNAIDSFINARLQSAGLRSVSEASPQTLLRRAYADLLGVPPSPEEADCFLRDKANDAYEKLIDRLLNDPRHGERWARHWLDLARYAESDGYEDDKVRPHAWRFRDYVIDSLNSDKPYDRFVREQLAGDELWPDRSEAWIATGFARLGPWDLMSKDPLQQRQDFLNDATDIVGAVFLGMTVGCARCHDHKYDPITQRDYYRLQAFFASVKRDARDLRDDCNEPPAVTRAFQRESAELKHLKSERDELLRVARANLEAERSSDSDKKKVTDGEVTKKVNAEHPGRLGKLNEQIKPLEARVRLHEPKADVVSHDANAKPKTRILLGGQLQRAGAEVVPGFPECTTEIDGNGQSRADLAQWLASPQNPLVARVMVNRLWQHHFSVGIVATASDFGRNGQRPTHPELLDWLAGEFIREGFGLKKMHRLIMTSAAYRRSSANDATAFANDPENKLLWRMHRRRLEGEALRDTILAVSGALNPAIGGPGVYAPLPKGVNVEFPNNDKELSWGACTSGEDRRRSVYLFQRRSLTYPLMDVFDVAPMNQSCAVRAQTTVAPQALALFNGEFAREAAGHFAARLRREAGCDSTRQIERAFQIAFARRPTDLERNSARKFLEEQATERQSDKDPQNMALIDFCHVILNSNELLYVD